MNGKNMIKPLRIINLRILAIMKKEDKIYCKT